MDTMLPLLSTCVCLCVCACARGRADAHGGRGWRGGCVCFWLMFVMQSFVSPTCCRAWGKSEGREMEVSPASRTFTEPHGPVVDSPFPRCVPGRDSESRRRAAVLVGGVLSHGEPCRAGRAGAPPFPAGSTPAPSPPRGLCTRVVGLHGCGKRGKGGFGGHVRL